MIIWSHDQVIFKKSSIAGIYNNFDWTHELESHGHCHLLSITHHRWITISGGLLRLFERRKLKSKYFIDAKCLEIVGEYILLGVGSKIDVLKMSGDELELVSPLFGHHSEIILIKADAVLDLILSVDKSGLVLIHELT